MTCPRCKNSLEERKYQKNFLIGYINTCPNCGGIWFNQGEITQYVYFLNLTEQIPNRDIQKETQVIGEYYLNKENPKLICPQCMLEMNTINYGTDSNIIVNRCPICEGIWTDKGEILKIAQYLKGNPDLKALGEEITKSIKKDNEYMNPNMTPGRYRYFYLNLIPIALGDDSYAKRVPVVTLSIMAINLIIFFFMWIIFSSPTSPFYSPAIIDITSHGIPGFYNNLFIQQNIYQLVIFTLYLWIFGDNVEDYLGKIRYLYLYLFLEVSSVLIGYLIYHQVSLITLGAQGAVSGIMGAYLVINPKSTIKTLLFTSIMEIHASIFIIIWLSIQMLLALFINNNISGVNWWGNIWGFFIGVLLLWYYKFHLNQNKNNSPVG